MHVGPIATPNFFIKVDLAECRVRHWRETTSKIHSVMRVAYYPAQSILIPRLSKKIRVNTAL